MDFQEKCVGFLQVQISVRSEEALKLGATGGQASSGDPLGVTGAQDADNDECEEIDPAAKAAKALRAEDDINEDTEQQELSSLSSDEGIAAEPAAAEPEPEVSKPDRNKKSRFKNILPFRRKKKDVEVEAAYWAAHLAFHSIVSVNFWNVCCWLKELLWCCSCRSFIVRFSAKFCKTTTSLLTRCFCFRAVVWSLLPEISDRLLFVASSYFVLTFQRNVHVWPRQERFFVCTVWIYKSKSLRKSAFVTDFKKGSKWMKIVRRRCRTQLLVCFVHPCSRSTFAALPPPDLSSMINTDEQFICVLRRPSGVLFILLMLNMLCLFERVNGAICWENQDSGDEHCEI